MSRPELSLFSYEILGLVGREGVGAHDLLQMARRGRILDWAGESQYYVEPKRLAKLGYLEARKEPGKTRERTVYSLTDKGLEALRAWAKTPVAFTPVKSEPLLRLLITDLVGEDVTRESVGTLRADIADLRTRLDETEALRARAAAPREVPADRQPPPAAAARPARAVHRRGRAGAPVRSAAVVPPERITREDVDSLVEARRELGDEMEPAVIDAFLDRVEAAAEARAAAVKPKPIPYDDGRGERLALSIISLGTGIPITAIAAEQGGVVGMLVVWAGIVGVNFSFSRRK